MSAPSARERLAQLFARVDAFFDQALASLPGPSGITCHLGCDDCCHRRFSVTAIEAEAIAEALAALPAGEREALAERAPHGDACALLGPDGSCAAYAARPLICRTHGLPIRFQIEEPEPGGGTRRLPVVDACPKNFAGRALSELPAGVVLDQTTLSTILGALDAAHAAERGAERGNRVEIAALAAGRP